MKHETWEKDRKRKSKKDIGQTPQNKTETLNPSPKTMTSVISYQCEIIYKDRVFVSL